MAGVIKLRLKNGKLFTAKDAAFVEICDESNQLACLVYMKDDGSVQIMDPGDKEFHRYIRFYKKKASPTSYIK